MATTFSLIVFARCSEVPRPPQPICTQRTLSPELAALRILNGAVAKTPAASAELFMNERRETLFFMAKLPWLFSFIEHTRRARPAQNSLVAQSISPTAALIFAISRRLRESLQFVS